MAEHDQKTVATTEHVPTKEHGGNFPPFDAHTFPNQLFWLAITFVLLYALMAKLALPRIGSILDDRRKRIEDDLAGAAALKSDSDAAIAAYEKALADARARAQAIAGETRERQAAELEKARLAQEAEQNAKLAEAEKSIAATRAAAMGNVRSIAADAASAIVSRLIGVTPSAEDVNRAVGDAIER